MQDEQIRALKEQFGSLSPSLITESDLDDRFPSCSHNTHHPPTILSSLAAVIAELEEAIEDNTSTSDGKTNLPIAGPSTLQGHLCSTHHPKLPVVGASNYKGKGCEIIRANNTPKDSPLKRILIKIEQVEIELKALCTHVATHSQECDCLLTLLDSIM